MRVVKSPLRSDTQVQLLRVDVAWEEVESTNLREVPTDLISSVCWAYGIRVAPEV